MRERSKTTVVLLLIAGALEVQCAHDSGFRAREKTARALLLEGSKEAAVAAYEEVIDLAPSATERARAACELAEGLDARDKTHGAESKAVETILRQALQGLDAAHSNAKEAQQLRVRVANDLGVWIAREGRYEEAIELLVAAAQQADQDTDALVRANLGSVLIESGRVEEGALEVIRTVERLRDWVPAAEKLLTAINEHKIDPSYGLTLADTLLSAGGVPEVSEVLLSVAAACQGCDDVFFEDLVLLGSRYLRLERGRAAWWKKFADSLYSSNPPKHIGSVVEGVAEILGGRIGRHGGRPRSFATTVFVSAVSQEADAARLRSDLIGARKLYAYAWEIGRDLTALGYLIAICVNENRDVLSQCRPLLTQLMGDIDTFLADVEELSPLDFSSAHLLAGDVAWSLRSDNDEKPARKALVYWRTALIPSVLHIDRGPSGLPISVFRRLGGGYRYLGQDDVAGRYERRVIAATDSMRKGAESGAGWAVPLEWIKEEASADEWYADSRRDLLVRLPLVRGTEMASLVGGDRPSIGDNDGSVTITQFQDLGCLGCGSVVKLVNSISADYPKGVRVVFMQNPGRTASPTSQQAAEASLCAWQLGRFRELNELLVAETEQGRTAFTRPALLAIARKAGLDTIEMRKCLDDRRFAKTIGEDVRQARRLGLVTGATGVFVNDVRLESTDEFGGILQKIDKELVRTATLNGPEPRR